MGQRVGQSSPLPSGARTRVSWRPANLHTINSILTESSRRSHLSFASAQQILTWHEQFARRVTPWGGWPSLPLEFSPEKSTRVDKALDGGEIHSFTATSVSSKEAGTAPTADRPSPLWPRLIPSRPPVRFAILRPPRAGDGNPPRSEFDGGRSMFPSRSGDFGLYRDEGSGARLPLAPPRSVQSDSIPPESLNETKQASWLPPRITPFEPRIILSASTSPRHEVRGGYPTITSWPALLSKTETFRAKPETEPTRVEVVEAPIQQTLELSNPESPNGAIQKLIERTVLPVPLPGMELRLTRRGRQDADPEDKTYDARERPPQPDARSPLPPSAPPERLPLDLNAVAEKVYQTLMRRQQRERERRGLY